MPKTDPDTDNQEFELELRQFRPLAPEPLTIQTPARRIRSWIPGAAWVTAALLVVTAPFIAHRVIEHRSPAKGGISAYAAVPPPAKPLTIGTAKVMLAGSQPFKAAVDALAFQPQTTPFANGEHSALDELSRERNSL